MTEYSQQIAQLWANALDIQDYHSCEEGDYIYVVLHTGKSPLAVKDFIDNELVLIRNEMGYGRIRYTSKEIGFSENDCYHSGSTEYPFYKAGDMTIGVRKGYEIETFEKICGSPEKRSKLQAALHPMDIPAFGKKSVALGISAALRSSPNDASHH